MIKVTLKNNTVVEFESPKEASQFLHSFYYQDFFNERGEAAKASMKTVGRPKGSKNRGANISKALKKAWGKKHRSEAMKAAWARKKLRENQAVENAPVGFAQENGNQN